MFIHGDRKAGAFLGLAGDTLKQWRRGGLLVEGADYFKKGRSIFYKQERLEQFITGEHKTTAEKILQKLLQ